MRYNKQEYNRNPVGKKEKYLLKITKEQCVLLRSICNKYNLKQSSYEPLKELINEIEVIVNKKD